jgi:hypothetical protein
MYQPRILSRRESLLRHADGGTNLADHGGEWYEAAPTAHDEIWDVASIGLTLGGVDLLGSLGSFAGADGSLELSAVLLDGYGAVRDMAAETAVTVGTGAEWRAGSHDDTFCDVEAGRHADGSERPGLRGLSDSTGVGPAQARWTSEPIPLRYGDEVVGAGWEIDLLGDAGGDVVGPPKLEVRTGTSASSGLFHFGDFQVLAQSADDYDQAHADISPALEGDVLQWRVTLPYVDPGVAARPGDAARRTAVVFSLCAWMRLAASRWHFESIAEMIDRSELTRHTQPGGLGDADLAVLRIPLQATVRGARGERMRARLTGDAVEAMELVEVWAIADLRHDPGG